MSTPKETCLRALSMMRGDDLYRARAAFAGATPKQMQEPWGASGKPRAQILAEYEAYDKQVDEAVNWINNL